MFFGHGQAHLAMPFATESDSDDSRPVDNSVSQNVFIGIIQYQLCVLFLIRCIQHSFV